MKTMPSGITEWTIVYENLARAFLEMPLQWTFTQPEVNEERRALSVLAVA